MHPEIIRMLARERQLDLMRAAERDRLVRAAQSAHADHVAASVNDHVTLRLDRVSDSPALYDLAELSGRRAVEGRYVVSEVEGRLVAAVPLDGGTPLADPFVRTFHLLPLLELRAAQIRRVEVQPRRWRRFLPRWA
jgi:hypothetical protein